MKRNLTGVFPCVSVSDLGIAAVSLSLLAAGGGGCAPAADDGARSAFDEDGSAAGGGQREAGLIQEASADAGRIVIGSSSKDAKEGGEGADGSCTKEGGCKELVGCGNGRIDPGHGEACDDGNTRAGDGCSADCTLIETGFACPQPGQPCLSTVRCGDGLLAGSETCDDGNTNDGDGCTAQCTVEVGYRCAAGADCTPICGDGLVRGLEQCDAPNVGSGCASNCRLEPGYVCGSIAATGDASAPLSSPDGSGAGLADAEAGIPAASAGEVGGPLAQCHRTKCGDSNREGNEACDDGNTIDGDGCSAACRLEPDCGSGTCLSKCGDGILLAPEQCDDGNTVAGDGCSTSCRIENGWRCSEQSLVTPDALNLQVVFRDFNSIPVEVDGVPVMPRHPDYEAEWEGRQPTLGLVLENLDADGKPVLSGCCSDTVPAAVACTCPYEQMMSNQGNFASWYRDTPGINISVKSSLLLPRQPDGSYLFDSNDTKGFFPLDGKGWVAAGKEQTAVSDPDVNDGKAHNFGFSSEVRYFFQYRGGERLTFSGDDDVWVFINRRLALDLGGLHPRREGTLVVDDEASDLGLTKGGLYEMVLFHSERHTEASNFKLTLTGFAPSYSTCSSICGDGIVAGAEQCDPGLPGSGNAGLPGSGDAGASGSGDAGVSGSSDAGVSGSSDAGLSGGADGAMLSDRYGGCTNECKRGPFCGDKTVQAGHEICDDGVNLTLYSADGSGCAPKCSLPARCGDGQIDALFGEECDNGPKNQDGLYGGCTTHCLLGPRCGDGVVQSPAEQCDDGNRLSGDGCDISCANEITK